MISTHACVELQFILMRRIEARAHNAQNPVVDHKIKECGLLGAMRPQRTSTAHLEMKRARIYNMLSAKTFCILILELPVRMWEHLGTFPIWRSAFPLKRSPDFPYPRFTSTKTTADRTQDKVYMNLSIGRIPRYDRLTVAAVTHQSSHFQGPLTFKRTYARVTSATHIDTRQYVVITTIKPALFVALIT